MQQIMTTIIAAAQDAPPPGRLCIRLFPALFSVCDRRVILPTFRSSSALCPLPNLLMLMSRLNNLLELPARCELPGRFGGFLAHAKVG